MFTALGSPKGALLGLTTAGLILAVSYSLYARPVALELFDRVSPDPFAVATVTPEPEPALDRTVTGTIERPVIESATSTIAGEPASQMPALLPSAGFSAALKLLTEGDAPAAYATASGLADPVERRTAQWAAIQYGQGTIPASAVTAFLSEAPQFANPSTFRTRLEQWLMKSDPSHAEVISLLGGAMPNTVEAQIALAAAYVADGQKERAARIARTVWIDNFLDAATEKRVLAQLGELLRAEDHWARAMHLMMHDRATATERLFDFMTPAQKSLAVARNAVSRKAANAKALLDAVDPSYKTNAVYNFSRAQRAQQFELWDDAIAWLDKGKPTDPDRAEWWYERQKLTREMINQGDFERAYRAAAPFKEGPDGRVVEAQFLAGWVSLTKLNKPQQAAEHFRAMAKHSTLADTVSQSNFWLGRALAAAGDTSGSREAYETAAIFPTVYYGLLARDALGLPAVELRSMPDWQDSEASFEQLDVVRGVRLLAAAGEKTRAIALLKIVAPSFETGGEMVLAARLARSLDAHDLAISIADTAEKRGTPLDLFSFPQDGLPVTKVAATDNAALLAIARQESRFQVNAVSSSGARGLMQLMPGTAEEMAKKLGLAYSPAKLTADPVYNTALGATYLDAQLARYEGSLLLAAAAYNAGPGNANKWIARFGDPRAEGVDPLVWVESIPFQETRKYVQRVFGNYMVYRARLGHADLDINRAMHSIY